MDVKTSSSEPAKYSRLVRRFTDRAGLGVTASSEEVIASLVARVRRECRGAGTSEQQTQRVLKKRNICSVQAVRDMHSDGLIEPVGQNFQAGFRVILKDQSNVARLRFTLAHEICHTFFYEFVPEIKFSGSELDPIEERLCDLGAAELLMPAVSIKKAARSMPVCLESLYSLANDYAVSLSAMFLRLRSLRLWKGEFSEWHRMLNGTFALKYFYGGSFKQWEWDDKSILNTAWNTPKFSYGHAFVKYDDDRGVKRFKPTHYEVGRFGNRILALWGSTIETPTRVYPLFEPLRSKEVTVARGPNTSNHQMLPSLSAIAYPLTR